jgi:hypothetical protein
VQGLRDGEARLKFIGLELEQAQTFRDQLGQCTDASFINKVEYRIGVLKGERDQVQLEMQSLRGREQATETRLYLSGDRHEVRYALQDKTDQWQREYDSRVKEDKRLEKASNDLMEEAPSESRTRKLAELRYRRTVMTAKIASAKRELDKALNEADDFEQRTEKDKQSPFRK